LAHNDGFLLEGISHNMPIFTVAAIRRWWLEVGRRCYPQAGDLLIQVDSGGPTNHRKWGGKVALQGLADEFGLVITVTHYPPGASKWKPIEHRLFGPVNENWAGGRWSVTGRSCNTSVRRERKQEFVAVLDWIRGSTSTTNA
jgi:hypothetical protein